MADAIEWFEGGFDAALEAARAAGRPLFLYWGAGWCPPCNRVKYEIFGREEFPAKLQSMVAIQLDGDSPNAQAMAERLKLRSYPTMVMYGPDGSEITRLPCELDGELFGEALMAARFAGHTAGDSMAAALDGKRALSPAEWTLLSNYSWDTDEGVLLQGRDLGVTLGTLSQLAAAAVTGEAQAAARQVEDAAVRLRLHALVAQAGRMADAAAPEFLLKVLADARLARANMDIFGNSGHQLVRAAPSRHAELATAMGNAAHVWAEDMWLSAPDRLTAVRLQMRMARMGYAGQDLPQLVRTRVEQALAMVDDKYGRHTLVNTAVSALNDAGLHAEAEALLQRELTESHAPYYFKLSLAAAAKRRGDLPGMLDWYEKAWRASVGSATRLQWGATYLAALIDTTPGDSGRIEAAASALALDFAHAQDGFKQRNLTQAQKLLAKLPDGLPLAAALGAGIQDR
ncbi:thioredoxin family protein [Pseudoduganella violaceinigra]|uniref:thioredoxin family protein n=1 Tax=Pseudoduganella violaceinigra TaxID=246602 RepID=UPI0003F77EDB|nr:thioredoxin family protein [Pseudoduganella violaceinigra]